jgi:hypothetical protein
MACEPVGGYRLVLINKACRSKDGKTLTGWLTAHSSELTILLAA